MSNERRKVYVDVLLKNDRKGRLIPLSITWEDDSVFTIDSIRAVCRAASTKVGGCGIRYTVSINGVDTFLFREDDKWFVEAKFLK